ncbi:MAG: hypothetical protein A2252_10650 [Elusimicrobia bacterium RIFOXYA2_FULL_39_19]|nr:MAG: hypothetical protein A2252_10650 [Elusimicrobia bacterium RIFOXYA2_FULL_39_19]
MVEKILVIEDEEETQEYLKLGLELEKYSVITALNGTTGLSLAKHEAPNLIILDLGLPDVDGIDVCKELKQAAATKTIPVVILTARARTNDKVTGLDAGADDYIIKPFEIKELVARMKALFRRMEFYAPQPDEVITKGGITIDVGKHKVTVNFKADIDLSPKEFQLLYLLMKNSEKTLERNYLLKSLWGYSDNVESRTVDVHIQRLRKKLTEQVGKFDDHLNKRIITMEGFGYKFVE